MIDRSLNYGRQHIARFLAACGPINRALDIGAGPGDDLLGVWRCSPDAELFAVELHDPFQQNLKKEGVTVWPLDLERDAIPAPDEHFDVVIANQILEHIKEVFWLLHEVTRTVRVGGHVLIGLPNLAALHNRLLLLFGRQPTPINSASAHVRGYTRHDLLRLLHHCFPDGYLLRQFGGSNFYPFPSLLARPLARLLPNMAWGIFLRLEKRRAYDGEFIRHLHNSPMQSTFYDGRCHIVSARAIDSRDMMEQHGSRRSDGS